MRTRIFCLSGIIAVLLLPGFSQEQIPKSDQPIRVGVDMVSLPVVVTDKVGRRITDLTKDDFQVFENGVHQDIAGFAATDEPIDVVLLLDTSGSTEFKLAKMNRSTLCCCWIPAAAPNLSLPKFRMLRSAS